MTPTIKYNPFYSPCHIEQKIGTARSAQSVFWYDDKKVLLQWLINLYHFCLTGKILKASHQGIQFTQLQYLVTKLQSMRDPLQLTQNIIWLDPLWYGIAGREN